MSSWRVSTMVALGMLLTQPAGAEGPGPGAAAGPEGELAARPRIGLVLSGGGARGASHVGVLAVLEELRIPVDAIAGTSMGSIVGGLYAAGLSPAELTAALTGIDWNRALTDRTGRDLLSYRRKQDDLTLAMKIRVGLQGWKPTLPLGIIQGQRLEVLLRSFVTPAAAIRDFDDLVYPYRAVAADLATTETVVLAEGDLVRAMRASMSVPAVFTPVEIDGRLLIDGGVANNLPVDVVRRMGVDVVIAVDIGAPLYRLDQITSAYAVNDQMLTGLMRRETTRQLASLGPRDIAIVPDLGDFGSADFTSAGAIIPLGEQAARAASVSLGAYSLSPEAWQLYRSRLKSFSRQPPTVAAVRVTTDADVSAEHLAGYLHSAPGRPLDLGQLADDLQHIYGLDLFDRVSYDLVDAGAGRVDLEVDARKRSWGPDYLQFGLALRDDLEGRATYDLSFRINRLTVNRAGAEWRTDLRLGRNQLLKSEFYQPFGGRGGWFWAGRAQARQQPLALIRSDGDTDLYRIRTWGGAFDVGRSFGSVGEIRLGLEREIGRAELDLGEGRSSEFDDGRVYLRLGTDTLDDAAFPRRGSASVSEISFSSETLGATDDLGRASFRGSTTKSWGANTLGFGVEVAAFFDDTKLAYPYTLGGFGRLSGYGDSQIVGRELALARVLYYRQLFRVSISAIEMPIYLGGSAEAGQTWLALDQAEIGDLEIHGALFLGVDSPLGPIYMGGGWGEGNHRTLFFLLGRTF